MKLKYSLRTLSLFVIACRGLFPGCRACAIDDNIIVEEPVR